MKNQNSISNKTKRNIFPFLILIILFILIIISIGFVYSEDTASLETSGTDSAVSAPSSQTAGGQTIELGLGKDFKPDPKLDKQTQDDLKNINNYALNNLEEVKGSRGNAKINEKTGEMTITDANGKQFATIPKGYDVKYDLQKSSNGLLFSNNGAKENSQLEIKGNKFNTEKNAEISYSKDEFGKQTIELKGKGNVGLSAKKLDGIEDAKFKLDKDNKITLADFSSTIGGKYSFQTSGKDTKDIKEYTFSADKGGKVTWNLDEKKIAGEKTIISLPDKSKLDSKKFSGELDDSGNIKHMATAGSAKFTDKSSHIYSGNDLNIYSDGTDVKSFNGNVVSYAKDNPSISLKGQVEYNNGKGLDYKGMEKDTFTKYSSNDFQIKSGNAEISNGKNTISIKDGEVSLKRENLVSDKSAESFSFTAYKKGGAVKSFIGNLDAEAGILNFKDQNNLANPQTANVILSNYEGILSGGAQGLQEAYIANMYSNLDSLKKSGAKPELINAYELAIRHAENVEFNNLYKDFEYGTNYGRDKSIDNLKEYLRTARDPVSEANAKIKIAELYNTGNLPDDIKNSVEYYNSAKESASSDKGFYKEQYNAASFGLAALYRQAGENDNALAEYDILISKNNENKDTKVVSDAYLGMAQTQIEKGDYKGALISLDNSVSANTINSQASDLKKSLRDGILKTIRGGLSKENTEMDNLFSDALGAKEFKSWTETPWQGVKSVFGESGRVFSSAIVGDTYVMELNGKKLEIDSQKAGIDAFRAVNQNGDINAFARTDDYLKRKEMIASAMGLKDYFLNPNDIDLEFKKEYGRFSTSNQERYDFIEKHYGGGYSNAEKLLSFYTQESLRVQKNNPDIALLLNPNSNKEDFKFKTGEGYVDPGLLKKTWGDTILNEVTLNNAVLMAAPFGTVTVAGKAYTFAGVVGEATGITQLEGAYNTGVSRLAESASTKVATTMGDALGSETLGNLAGTTASMGVKTGGFAARESAKLLASSGLGEIPYLGPVANQLPFMSMGGEVSKTLGTAERIESQIERAGVKSTTLEGFDTFLKKEVPGTSTNLFAPVYSASQKEIDAIAANGERLGITEFGEATGGAPRLFRTSEGDTFRLVPEESSTLSIPGQGIPKPADYDAMIAQNELSSVARTLESQDPSLVAIERDISELPKLADNAVTKNPEKSMEEILQERGVTYKQEKIGRVVTVNGEPQLVGVDAYTLDPNENTPLGRIVNKFNRDGYKVYVDPSADDALASVNSLSNEVRIGPQALEDPEYLASIMKHETIHKRTLSDLDSPSPSPEELGRTAKISSSLFDSKKTMSGFKLSPDAYNSFAADELNAYWMDVVDQASSDPSTVLKSTAFGRTRLFGEGIDDVTTKAKTIVDDYINNLGSSETTPHYNIETRNGGLSNSDIVFGSKGDLKISTDWDYHSKRPALAVSINQGNDAITMKVVDKDSIAMVIDALKGSSLTAEQMNGIKDILRTQIVPQLDSLSNSAKHTVAATDSLLEESVMGNSEASDIRTFIARTQLATKGMEGVKLDLSQYYDNGFGSVPSASGILRQADSNTGSSVISAGDIIASQSQDIAARQQAVAELSGENLRYKLVDADTLAINAIEEDASKIKNLGQPTLSKSLSTEDILQQQGVKYRIEEIEGKKVYVLEPNPDTYLGRVVERFDRKGIPVYVDDNPELVAGSYNPISNEAKFTTGMIADPEYLRVGAGHEYGHALDHEIAVQESATPEEMSTDAQVYSSWFNIHKKDKMDKFSYGVFSADELNQYWRDLVSDLNTPGRVLDPTKAGIADSAAGRDLDVISLFSGGIIDSAGNAKQTVAGILENQDMQVYHSNPFYSYGEKSFIFAKEAKDFKTQAIEFSNGYARFSMRNNQITLRLNDPSSLSSIRDIASGKISGEEANKAVYGILQNEINPQLDSLLNSARHSQVAVTSITNELDMRKNPVSGGIYMSESEAIRDFVARTNLAKGFEGKNRLDLQAYYDESYPLKIPPASKLLAQ
jgi:hypothetical protein